MTFNLSADLEAAVACEAQRLGTTPIAVVEMAVREQLMGQPTDSRNSSGSAHEKLKRILTVARPCEVALSNEALSSEGLYD